ncbi:calcium-binding protein [Bauldia litoralis]|uniref:calcium-binding protein n=1 Tax=Bauldia litoralis TaxID=665467 RepID=UPI003265EA3B
MATYIGTIYNDVYTGSAQNQYGIDGADFLSPSSDNKAYYLYGGNGNDDLYGFSFNDELYGGSGKDLIVGLNGNDYIEGGSGNDMLYGSYGNDELSGGRGKDIFVFDTKLSSKNNLDTITDYDTSKDLIDLDKAIFTKIGKVGHTLKSNKFVVGNKAKDSKDRIIYNDDNGVLKYDPDGNGSKNAKKFAILDSDLDMSHNDFFVI